MFPTLVVLLAQGRTLPDTQVVRMMPSGLQQAVLIAELTALLLVFALLVATILLIIQAKKSFDKVKDSLEEVGKSVRYSLDEVGKDVRDLSENAKQISKDISEVAHSVRGDVADVHQTVKYANERARQAVTALADRIDQFNEAVGAVQRDTQGAIVAATAAIRGVRAGISAFRGGKKRRNQVREDARDDEMAESPSDLPARPRLRRRAPAET